MQIDPQGPRSVAKASLFKRLTPALSILLLATASAASAPSITLVFERFNQTFVDTVDEIAPIHKGPLVIRPSSPHHRLTVVSHSVELAARGDLHDLVVTMRFHGEAELVMQVETAGVPMTLEDEVSVPEQEKRVDAVIRLERAESGEGFDITTVELPKDLQVEIESRLAGQIVSLCRAVTMFSLSDAGCDGLELALANPRVNLPPPGSEYYLADSELTPDELRRLLDYLSAAREHRSADASLPAF